MSVARRLFAGGPWHGQVHEVGESVTRVSANNPDGGKTEYLLGVGTIGPVEFPVFTPANGTDLGRKVGEAIVKASGISGATVERRFTEDL